MGSGKNVFIVGPGFIGWNVLDLLIAEKYNVSGLVRREEHARGIEKSGAKAVLGDLHDKDLIAKHAAASDIVFHTATADDLPSVEAVLDGVKQRAGDRKSTIFIHTSGTSVLDDGANGEYKSVKIYRDDEPDEINKLPDDAPHREIDLAIVKAQKELGDKAKIAIMTPPLIYGYNPAHDRVTIQIPTLTRFALKHGYAPYVGKGESVESQIHVMDLARAYIVLLHKMEDSPPSYTLNNPYFFCENGHEFSWKEVAEEIARGLHDGGNLIGLDTRTAAKDVWGDLMGDLTPAVVGLNSRSRAIRLRELGWEAKEKALWESYREDELPAILAQNK